MFRFTIRELVLLTVIAAVLFAWWVDHAKLLNANQVLQGEILSIDRKWSAFLENERRIANLRAMEAWGPVDGWANPNPGRIALPGEDFGP